MLAKNRLTLAVRNLGEEVGLGIRDEIHHRLQVGPERGDGAVPRGWVRRTVALWPVARRELGRDVDGGQQ